MPGSLNPKDFTEEEIRRTLGEKLRRKRSSRLERFRRTGRAIVGFRFRPVLVARYQLHDC